MTRRQQNLSIIIVAAALAAILATTDIKIGSKPPIDEDGLFVAIVEESSTRNELPVEVVGIISSPDVRVCTEKLGGTFRLLDPQDDEGNRVDLSRDLPAFQKAMALPRTSLPWLIVSCHPNGGGYSGPLPLSLEETLKVIREAVE